MNHRLAAQRRQVEYRQPTVSQPKHGFAERNEAKAAFVGASVGEVRHPQLDGFADSRLVLSQNADDAAHRQDP